NAILLNQKPKYFGRGNHSLVDASIKLSVFHAVIHRNAWQELGVNIRFSARFDTASVWVLGNGDQILAVHIHMFQAQDGREAPFSYLKFIPDKAIYRPKAVP